MSKQPDLSITIVSYNTRDLTRQCLRSIYESTRSIGFDVTLVDNDSSDGSPEMVREEFPDVHVIVNSANLGLAGATNQGLEKGVGRYLMALNSDTVIQPGAFDTLVRFMDEHPDAGGATPKLVLPDGQPHPVFCGKMPTPRSELLDALSALHGRIAEAVPAARLEQGLDFEKTREVPCILWGTAFIVRREVYEAIGGQDPRFFVYGEDVDWVMRIVKAGWKLYCVADAVVVHYGGRSTQQAGVKMSAQLWRSRCRLIRKHYGLTASLALRLAIAFVCGTRLAKWLVLYAISKGSRGMARARIEQMWAAIRAALAY